MGNVGIDSGRKHSSLLSGSDSADTLAVDIVFAAASEVGNTGQGMPTRWVYLLLVGGFCGMMAVQAQTLPAVDLANMTLEDLMNVQVTSVSKKEQKLSHTAAAVYVISQEDIRRSGATNIPDLLRQAPGVDVAQIDANTYAISIRGFNDRLADKVLVTIDGRTVYTPTTSGVYWDQQDVPLEDIDRIEVIRGPGGTVWGANAVNGVINIITKNANDTKGGLVRTGGGSQVAAGGLAQYGGEIGQGGAYRVFENYSNTGSLTLPDGQRAADGWHMFHTGFRSDWTLSPTDTLTVQGDFMQTGEGQTISVVFANALPLMRTFNDSVVTGSGNLQERWNHTLANGSTTSLQVYVDRNDRHDEGVHEGLDTFDIDFQHHWRIGSRNDIVWGLGYRFTSDGHTAGYGKTYLPLSQANNLFSVFFQDQIRIAESVSITLGSKLEHQPYTGFQFEPSAQMVWTPTDRQTVWLSGSQAVRAVNREEEGLQIEPYTFELPGGGFGVAQYSGNTKSQVERLRDFEIGYRAQPVKQFSVDVASFAGLYHNLETLDPGEPYFTTDQGPPHLVLPSLFGNTASAHTYGAEVFANWNATSRWRISAGYTAIHLNVILDPGSQDPNEPERADNTPENQIQVRSQLNLAHNLEWDSAVYYVGHLRDGGNGPVAAYTRVDTRVGWRIGRHIELSVAGQNLLTPRHAEFHDAYEVNHTLVERSVLGKITLRF
jgi:iron complex outermembrane receptor protein